LVGSIDRWRPVLYPYIYFHNELDAMYFVSDQNLFTQ